MVEVASDDRYAAFYARSFPRVARELARTVGADAEDIAQEALLVARGSWATVAALDKPEAWVRRVALRIAGRRAQRERDRGVLEAATAAPIQNRAPDLDLVAAILDLPDRHAAAIRLHHLEDRPIAEVAQAIGVSEGAAKVLLVRARRVLAEHLTGISGRWVGDHAWTVDSLVRHLRANGWATIVEQTVDGDWNGRGGAFELTVSNGGYLLRRDDGQVFDRGDSRVDRSGLEMAPNENTGRVRYRATVDGRQLRLRFETDDIGAPFLGVPEAFWGGVFYEVADFRRADRAPRP